MNSSRLSFICALVLLTVSAESLAGESVASLNTESGTNPGVHLIGEMRRMFMQHDIRPNVDLSRLNTNAHLYALGPIAGLKGEVTVLDSQVFVSKVAGPRLVVDIEPKVKTVF